MQLVMVQMMWIWYCKLMLELVFSGKKVQELLKFLIMLLVSFVYSGNYCFIMVDLTIWEWLKWSCTFSIRTWSLQLYSLPIVFTILGQDNHFGHLGQSHSTTWCLLSSRLSSEQFSKWMCTLNQIKKLYSR